jgi:hypothetical protein
VKRLIDWLQQGADSLGLEVEFDYEVKLLGREPLRPLARLVNLGGSSGMLIFGDYGEVKDHTTELVNAGFGYTVLDEPRTDETLDLESFKEMAIDWGWMEPSSERPEQFA